jgi:large subunit ribosomal protein L1
MDKDKLLSALKKVKEGSKKRNFKQRYECIINLKDLNLKKPEEQVDLFVLLPHMTGKKKKICAFVGAEMKQDAEKACDRTVLVDDFERLVKEKNFAKKLGAEYDYFIAQANLMPKVAQAFGKVLGPRGKMPNPKSGCVVPPKTNLVVLCEKLQKTVKASAKTQLSIKCPIGAESMSDSEIAENILALYNALVHKLPKEAANIKSTMVKLTMSKPVKVE